MSKHRGRKRWYRYISILFIPYHVKEEGKAVPDKEMEKLHHLGIIKKDFSSYSSPVILLSRKVTKDEEAVTGFRF